MKKNIVPFIIFYILGIIIGLYCKKYIVLFLLSFIIFLFIYSKYKKNKINILIILSAIIIGILYINFYSLNWEKISKNINSENLIVEIVNLEKETDYQKIFKAKILNNKYKNKLVILKANSKISNKISIGSKIQISGEKQEIETERNTGRI